MEDVFVLKIMKNETTEAFTGGRCELALGSPRVSCVDVDLGAWVERRSCLQPAEAGSSMMCA